MLVIGIDRHVVEPAEADIRYRHAILQPIDVLTDQQAHSTSYCPEFDTWHIGLSIKLSFTLTIKIRLIDDTGTPEARKEPQSPHHCRNLLLSHPPPLILHAYTCSYSLENSPGRWTSSTPQTQQYQRSLRSHRHHTDHSLPRSTVIPHQ